MHILTSHRNIEGHIKGLIDKSTRNLIATWILMKRYKLKKSGVAKMVDNIDYRGNLRNTNK